MVRDQDAIRALHLPPLRSGRPTSPVVRIDIRREIVEIHATRTAVRRVVPIATDVSPVNRT